MNKSLLGYNWTLVELKLRIESGVVTALPVIIEP